ncbi:MAG: hypothetical protein GXP16_15980 [Gammaproteobacteria bacterium]|nr:hypothetical protein [Gammaproteobacteria bacterium]
MAKERRPLTQDEWELAFLKATASFPRQYADQIVTGMSDDELSQALQATLGIFGGSGGPDQLSITYQGSGLRIWASWHVHNHVSEKPLFAGKATIAMARELYGIADPEDGQMCLF